MSHSSSPTNRNSIFGWVKNLKRGNLLSNESVNEITSDNDLLSTESRSPSKSTYNSIHPHSSYGQLPNMNTQPFPSSGSPPSHDVQPVPISNSGSEFLRPLLNHKSRSSNNVNRVRSNSHSQSEKSASIRQHRDSFLQHNSLVDENSKYFGVPLEQAIKEASAKISILNTNPSDPGVTYGEIPIVVAKCGVYLKTNGLTVEGIFRVGGSSKRLKELQVVFNSPPDFGKKLNWDGYTVHDAASILRRYLNALPEPLIPLELYESFRDPLRSKTRIINYMKYKAENPKKPANSAQPPDSAATNSAKTAKSPSPESPAPDLLDSSESQPLTEANIGRLNHGSSSSNEESYRHKDDDQPFSSSLSQSDLSHLKSGNTTGNHPEHRDAADAEAAAEEAKKSAQKSAKKSKNYRKLSRDVHEVIDEYKQMVYDLPILSKQLLFYILDLLSMVQNHSDENLMSSRNLAAIFQPSILSHPSHDMDPVEYALSQLVVEFLIQYAYKLLPKQTGSLNPSPSQSLKKSSSSPQNLQTDVHDVVGDDCDEIKPKPTVVTNNISIGLKGGNPANVDCLNQSYVTSTSTTPIDSEGVGEGFLAKPQPPIKRQYSKSLPSSNQELDGFTHDSSKNIAFTQFDDEFGITDDDNEIDISDLDDLRGSNLNLHSGESKEFDHDDEGAKSSPKVAIIVSTPSTTSVAKTTT